jgi:hypothetical protein
MRWGKAATILVALATFATAVAQAERLTVVELFTSQSCSSCPPAEAYLAELAQRPDLLALELHVDYWNDLVYGRAGRWQDPFSDPAFTERQRVYNLLIRDRQQIYTPQMVVDGRREAVGSRRQAVEAVLTGTASGSAEAALSVERAADGAVAAVVEGRADRAATLWWVRFLEQNVTEVEGGENQGMTLRNHNVVRAIEPVGEWDGGAATIELPPLALEPGERCALLLQAGGNGPILAATPCPALGS